MQIKNHKLKYFIIAFLLFVFIFIINGINQKINFSQNYENKKKRIGIVAYHNDNNVGNQLLKYSMNLILKRFGFEPILISLNELNNVNIDFLKKFLFIKEIKNYYTDLNESDFDYLIVNSDQVWAPNYKNILEVGFLSFAKNWTISKIIYGASIAFDSWISSIQIINYIKLLIKQFSGVSVREESSIEVINYYFGIKPLLVLDPTLLIDQSDYLTIIKNFKMDIDLNQKYLCSYILDTSPTIETFIQNISNILNYKILQINITADNFIEKFLFSINISNSVITDSYHGTLFSIIFNKPFITFINSNRGNVRFFSLNQTLHLNNRFIYPKQFNKMDLETITKEPNFNMTNFNILRERSIKFLKDNLGVNG